VRLLANPTRTLLVILITAAGCRPDPLPTPPERRARPQPRTVSMAVSTDAHTPAALAWLLRTLAAQEIRRTGLPIRFEDPTATIQLVVTWAKQSGGRVGIRLRDGFRRPPAELRWERCCSAAQVAKAREAIRQQLSPLPGAKPRPAPLWSGSAYQREDLENALVAGMHWLLSRALQADPFALSDYLQVFLILSHSARDPVFRSLGATVGPRLARRYLRLAPPPRAGLSASKLFDQAAAQHFVERFGVRVPPARRKALAAALRKSPRRKLTTLDPKAVKAGPLLDALVDLYFPHKLGLPSPHPYAELVSLARRFRFRIRPFETLRHLENRTYLATHLIYVLSDFSRYRLRPAHVQRALDFIRQVAPRYLVAEDVETLGELADALKITGAGYDDPLLQQMLSYLLKKQNNDGSWGPMKARSAYERYHTTWTAFNGLLEYRFNGTGPRDAAIRRAWLGENAAPRPRSARRRSGRPRFPAPRARSPAPRARSKTPQPRPGTRRPARPQRTRPRRAPAHR